MNTRTKNMLFTGGKMAMNIGLGALAPVTGGATIPLMIGANAALRTAEVLSDEEKKKNYGFKSLVSDTVNLGVDAATAGIGGSALKPLAKTALNTGLKAGETIGNNLLAGNDRLDQQGNALMSMPIDAIQNYGKYVAEDGIVIDNPPYSDYSQMIPYPNNAENITSSFDKILNKNNLQYPQLDLVLKPKIMFDNSMKPFKRGGFGGALDYNQNTEQKVDNVQMPELVNLEKKKSTQEQLFPNAKIGIIEEKTTSPTLMDDYLANLERANRFKTYETIGKGAILAGMMANSLLRKPSEKLSYSPVVAPRLTNPSTAMKAAGERIIDASSAATMESIKRSGGTPDMYAGVGTAKYNALKDLGTKAAMSDVDVMNQQAQLDMQVDAQNKQGALGVTEANIKMQQAENAAITQERANLIGGMFQTATDQGNFMLNQGQKKIDYKYLQQMRKQMGDEAFYKWYGELQMQNKYKLATPVAEK